MMPDILAADVLPALGAAILGGIVFAALIVVLSYYEGRWIGVAMAITIGSIGGLLNKSLGFNIGSQFMTFYASPWIAQKLFGI